MDSQLTQGQRKRQRLIKCGTIGFGVLCAGAIVWNTSFAKESSPVGTIAGGSVFVGAQDDVLKKYRFMTEAKKKAEEEFRDTARKDLDALLSEQSGMLEEYSAEVEEQRKIIASERKVDEDHSVNEYSVDQLIDALNALELAASKLTVSVNEVPQVASAETADALIPGEREDLNYIGSPVMITGQNRENLERIVMGEAGGEGFVGAALVAQTIHDTMIRDNCYDALAIKASHAYTCSLDKEANEDVRRAVAFIFDEGGMAVRHRLIYFYAPKVVQSSFHEGRKFVVSHGGHRFFDDWE